MRPEKLIYKNKEFNLVLTPFTKEEICYLRLEGSQLKHMSLKMADKLIKKKDK